MSYYSTDSEEHKDNISGHEYTHYDDLGYSWDEYVQDLEDLEVMEFNDSVKERDDIHQTLLESES